MFKNNHIRHPPFQNYLDRPKMTRHPWGCDCEIEQLLAPGTFFIFIKLNNCMMQIVGLVINLSIYIKENPKRKLITEYTL